MAIEALFKGCYEQHCKNVPIAHEFVQNWGAAEDKIRACAAWRLGREALAACHSYSVPGKSGDSTTAFCQLRLEPAEFVQEDPSIPPPTGLPEVPEFDNNLRLRPGL